MDLIFDEFETYRKAALGWGLEFVQLDKGPFHGVLRQAATAKVQLTHFNFNRKFYQQGEIRAPGRTFAIFLNRVSPMRWRNSPLVDADTLVVFPSDGALDALTVPGFDAVSISVDCAFLQAVGQQNDLERSCAAVPDHAVNFQTDGRIIAALRTRVRALLDGRGDAHRHIESDIARLILEAIAVRLPPASRAGLRKRDRAFAAAVEIIEDVEALPSVPELGKMVGASERTLRYAFAERVGVSPKHYINAQRLKRVRQRLLDAPVSASPVQDIAAELGYWHTGQFAADYHAMFDELPSETLKRCAP